MKKFLFLPISMLLCFIMLFPAFGAEFNNIWELYGKWVSDGYPEYVTGIWSTYGDTRNLTIGIMEGDEGEKGKEEILSLIEDDSSVSFTVQKYSRNYLCSIMETLVEYINKGLAFSCGGVYEMENVVKITLLEDHINDEVSESVKLEMQEKFGDAIVFDYGEGFIAENLVGTIDLEPTRELIKSGDAHIEYGFHSDVENASSDNTKIFYIVLIAALTLAMVLPVFVLRRNKLMKASNGETFSETPLNDKEIESMIKDSEIQFPSELEEKIINEIKKK